MKSTWPTVAFLLAIPALYFLTLGRARFAEIERLTSQIRSLNEQTPAFEVGTALALAASRNLEILERLTSRLRARFAKDAASRALLFETAATMQAFDLDSERAENLEGQAQGPFEIERVDVAVRGAFPDLFRFIGQIERGQPPIRVTSLSVQPTGSSGRLRAEMSLQRLWTQDS